MSNLEKWDFIKILDFNREELDEEEMKDFIGTDGIIIGIFGDSGYRYDVILFNMGLQKKAMDNGGILWRDEDLEKLEIEGVK
ncbi:hypothetical protein CIW83_09290 [Tissierella sp. P1]|uniref:hypothetical protein n=1 Tax=Tissierella sp. P1 TaxID=1280483 RepID=UPI000BA0B10C|nr:hypothetical protein [Tissierella sp. P1]OZV12283.1 hypothetical protein CIW83_09290 [Tissierella sp. P1]